MRPRPTFGNVVSLIALFVALGGSAYAISLGKGDVKSKHIAKNAVKSKHLKDGKAVQAADIVDGAVGAGAVGDGALTGADIADDSLTDADLDESSLPLPKAYARVEPDGTISQAHGITQAQVTKTGGDGAYCFDVDAEHAQATGAWRESPSGQAIETIFVTDNAMAVDAGLAMGLQTMGCSAAADFAVGTGSGPASAADAGFWVMFF